jgi:hypothetical protein
MEVVLPMKPCPLHQRPDTRFAIQKSLEKKAKEQRARKKAEKAWVIHKHPLKVQEELVVRRTSRLTRPEEYETRS